MTNVLEDMKAVWSGMIWDIKHIHFMNNSMILSNKKQGDTGEIPFSAIKPILKFPDKDIWSGGLLKYRDDLVMIYHNGLGWKALDIFKQLDGKFLIDYNPVDIVFKTVADALIDDHPYVGHLYDKEALDHLPEDVVNKLKEMVR